MRHCNRSILRQMPLVFVTSVSSYAQEGEFAKPRPLVDFCDVPGPELSVQNCKLCPLFTTHPAHKRHSWCQFALQCSFTRPVFRGHHPLNDDPMNGSCFGVLPETGVIQYHLRGGIRSESCPLRRPIPCEMPHE